MNVVRNPRWGNAVAEARRDAVQSETMSGLLASIEPDSFGSRPSSRAAPDLRCCVASRPKIWRSHATPSGARTDRAELLADFAAAGSRWAAPFGASDLAEIGVLSAAKSRAEIVCTVDAQQADEPCGGLPIVAGIPVAPALADPASLDGLIRTDTQAPEARFDELIAGFAASGLDLRQIVASTLLGISALPVVAEVAV